MSGATAIAPSADSAIEALLGGKAVLKKRPTSVLDWVDVIRNGLPAAAIDSLLGSVQLSQAELARAVGIPERTLARRKREGVLNSDESAKLLRLARVVGRANEVFESTESSIHWLKAPNTSFGGRTPRSVLRPADPGPQAGEFP